MANERQGGPVIRWSPPGVPPGAPPESPSNVVPFAARPPAPNRFSVRDRAEALRWAEEARKYGYSRVVFDTVCERFNEEPGDFILIYKRDAVWASWGIGCGPKHLTLWRSSTGVTVGRFATMRETLAAVMNCGTFV